MLDSTDPAQVKAFENKIDIAKTLFIVSSKSGSTLEPNIFKQYFFERTKQAVGADKAGSHFIAITDPGSKMQQVAEARSFPAYLLRPAFDRRPLFRAFEFRHGAGGGDGTGHQEISRPHAGNGASVRSFGAGRGKSRRSAGNHSGHGGARADAIKSRSSLRRIFPISAPGLSNCWPSPRAKLGKASSPWTAKSWPRRKFTATIAFLPTSA